MPGDTLTSYNRLQAKTDAMVISEAYKRADETHREELSTAATDKPWQELAAVATALMDQLPNGAHPEPGQTVSPQHHRVER